MAKSVIIHIGGEKTGTTTLQHFLTRNASKLRRYGFYYPSETENICFEYIAHFPVVASLIETKVDFVGQRRRKTLPLVREALAGIISAADETVILSCEHFSSRLDRVRQLEMLREALPVDEVKVLYYIREPTDLALAYWSTIVRCGGRHTFNSNFVRPENRYYNHLETIKLWSTVFGASNVIVREFNRSSGDIRASFCTFLGVPLADMELVTDQNQSLDVLRLEVLRHLNCFLPSFHESEHGWRRGQEIRKFVVDHIPEGQPLSALMTDDERTHIKTLFYEVHKEIDERYFSGKLSRDWFPYDVDQAKILYESSHNNALRYYDDPELACALARTIICLSDDKIERDLKRRNSRRMTIIKNFFKGFSRRSKEL